MSDLIRIAQGHVSAYTLLTTDSYLVSNWARTSDMKSHISWRCSQPEGGELRTEFVQGLGVGTGGFYGGYSGILEFMLLTPQMRNYIEETLLYDAGISAVTVYAHAPHFGDNEGFAVFQGELVSPYAINAEGSYSRFSDRHYTNNQYLFRRGNLVQLEVLATLDGDVLSTLDGNYLASLE